MNPSEAAKVVDSSDPMSVVAALTTHRDERTVPIGLFVKLPLSEVCEMVSDAGFDFVIIDTEHSLLSVRDVYEMIVTYSNRGVRVLVRVTGHDHGDAQRYLDAGASGILVPHVTTAAVAEQVVRQLRFPPDGTRGQGTASRAGMWGAIAGSEYLRRGREETLRMVMIENQAGIENLDAILATDGLSAVFAGPGDLSLSLGEPSGSPAVAAAVDRIASTSARAGMPVGTVAATLEQARVRVEQGCTFLVLGNDAGIFSRAVRTTATSAREQMWTWTRERGAV